MNLRLATWSHFFSHLAGRSNVWFMLIEPSRTFYPPPISSDLLIGEKGWVSANTALWTQKRMKFIKRLFTCQVQAARLWKATEQKVQTAKNQHCKGFLNPAFDIEKLWTHICLGVLCEQVVTHRNVLILRNFEEDLSDAWQGPAAFLSAGFALDRSFWSFWLGANRTHGVNASCCLSSAYKFYRKVNLSSHQQLQKRRFGGPKVHQLKKINLIATNLDSASFAEDFCHLNCTPAQIRVQDMSYFSTCLELKSN